MGFLLGPGAPKFRKNFRKPGRNISLPEACATPSSSGVQKPSSAGKHHRLIPEKSPALPIEFSAFKGGGIETMIPAERLHCPPAGEPQTLSDFACAAYGELRRIAAHYFKREPKGHTLQATALVHEVYI